MSYAKELENRIYADTLTQEPVRVVIYARVSTDNDGQKDSCSNQIELAKNYLENYPNVILKNIYVDDGVSGKSEYGREAYNQLLCDIDNDKIDLIVVKSMSRLNRDEYNSFALINLLKEHETTILTLEDKCIHDFEDRKERLFNSLKFAMDADYVSDQSEKGKLTHKLRCERKELSAKDISYGYSWDKNTKSIYINSEQAENVIFIFEEYVYRNNTPSDIKLLLDKKGYKLCSSTISKILQDERYIGNFYINKTTSKLGSGKTHTKKIKLPKEEWILVERPDLAFLDKELFNLAQELRANKKTIYKTRTREQTQGYFQGTHIFSSKIFCACCGKPFRFDYADRKKTIPIYRINNHSECEHPAGRLNEDDLEQITRMALKATISNQEEIIDYTEQVLIEAVTILQDNTKDVDDLIKKKNKLENKIDKQLDLLSEEDVLETTKERIKLKIKSFQENVDELERIIAEKESLTIDEDYISNKISSIRSAIDELKKFKIIDKTRVNNYIDKIFVYENNQIDMILKSGTTLTFNLIMHETTTSGDNGEGADKSSIGDALYYMPVTPQ